MTESAARRTLVAVMGPTASGKTALSVGLARAMGGALINADSRQAVAELSVGVCKPEPAELLDVSCVGLDWSRLGQGFTARAFVELARAAMEGIWAHGQTPILVGGSGLYLRSLLEGFDFGDGPIRQGIAGSGRATGVDPQAVLAELERLSPSRAQTVDRHNPRRVMRALELERAGLRPSRRQQAWTAVRIGLDIPRPVLRDRIELRAQRILGPELLEEVRCLLAQGFSYATVAESAIGYREALELLHGELTRDAALKSLIRRTWRYAKAQMTWLRREPNLIWIDASAKGADMLAEALEVVRHQTKEESP